MRTGVVVSLAFLGLAATTAGGDLDVLLRDLQAPVPRVRAYAARRLADTRAAEALPALTAALKDPDAEVRKQVVRALTSIRDAKAAGALAEADEVEESFKALAPTP